jgi:hypothetical protein
MVKNEKGIIEMNKSSKTKSLLLECRVARFFLVFDSKTGKMYQINK